MLNIEQNDRTVELNYTVENNLVPTNEQLGNLLKTEFFLNGIKRTQTNADGSGYYFNNRSFKNYINIQHGMFENGHVAIYDENDNVLSTTDLRSSTPNDSNNKGSINLQQSKQSCINGKVRYKLVLDYPTNVGNGIMKKIVFYPLPKSSSLVYGTMPSNPVCFDKLLMSFSDYTSHKFYLDKDKIITSYDMSNKDLYYNDKIYTYNEGSSSYDSLYLFDNKLYSHKEIDRDKKVLRLNEIKLDDNELIARNNGTMEINYSKISNTYINDDNNDFKLINILEFEGSKYALFGVTIPSDYSSTSYVYSLGLLDEDYNVVEFKVSSSTKSMSYVHDMVRRHLMPPNENTGVIEYITTNGSGCLTVDLKNFDIILDTSKVVPTNGSNYMIYAYYNDINYSINDIKGKMAYNKGYDYIAENFIVFTCQEYKPPIVITLDEPLVKTEEQTMKIILNIEIE